MPRRKETLVEKLKPIIEKYSDILEDLVNVDRQRVFEGDYWSALKLLCLASYIHTCYIKIISNYFSNAQIYFIDLLAGSGIARVSKCKNCEDESPENCRKCSKKERPKQYFPSSTLLAASAKPAFYKIYFNDKSEKNIEVLKKRLDLAKSKFPDISYQDFIEDCNTAVDTILDNIEKTRQGEKFHALVFVDNQGLDADWNTIEKLLTKCKYCDIIINFPTRIIENRVFSLKKSKKLEKFIGCKNVKEEIRKPEAVLPYYIKKIKKTNPKKDVEKIPVPTGLSYHYDLLIISKKSKNKNNTYWRYIKWLKNTIKKITIREVESALDILKGKQKTLFERTTQPKQ